MLLKKAIWISEFLSIWFVVLLFSWQQHVFTCMIGELHRIDRVDFKAQHLAVTQVKHKYILTCIVEGKLPLILFCKGSGSRFILRMQLVKQSGVLCITSTLNFKWLHASNALQTLLNLTCKGKEADLFPTYPLTTWLWTDRTLQSILA